MNEFETDLEKPYEYSDEWLAAASGAVETALDVAGDGLSNVVERVRDFHNAVGRPAGRKAHAAFAVMHENPYPTVLVGIGTGIMLGFLFTSRHLARNG